MRLCTSKLRDLLRSDIDQVSEDALDAVRAHIAAHDCGPPAGETTHESWLQIGTAFVRTNKCPFCGQALTDRTLIHAYNAFFGDA